MLFDPISFRKLTLRNRLVVSPMCQYSSPDGFATDWHLVHLGSRAVGGTGLVFTEATAVEPVGRISTTDLGLWKEDHIPMLKRITNFIHQQGAAAGIQLAHAGRKASTAAPWEGGHPIPESHGGWQPVAPSPLPFDTGYPVPHALSLDEIQAIQQAFRQAAARAIQAGFDVVELHAAHGYLLHEFLSPVTNHRTDRYGGSLENRKRMTLETAQVLRQVWPSEKPVFVRISTTDWLEDESWTPDQSVELAKELKQVGIDLIDCSSGGTVPTTKIPATPGYQVPFAERIRREADIRTGAVGLINQAEQAEQILREEKADLIFVARQFLRDPYFAAHAATKLKEKLAPPPQYGRAW